MRQLIRNGCCCYHKGTYFQANHNDAQIAKTKADVVVATTKVRIFKQITTEGEKVKFHNCCCCYHKGTYFQANHNIVLILLLVTVVVVATTKVRIFKQITTLIRCEVAYLWLLLLPQRYVFSSKSQLFLFGCNSFIVVVATTKVRIFKQITTAYIAIHFLTSCCCYHKGTYFQANHNTSTSVPSSPIVVVATTKVRIFKQITTCCCYLSLLPMLLLLPQRYVFSSKSQISLISVVALLGCCCYHKGTYFQANHNACKREVGLNEVVVATTKVRIFKQITTGQWGQECGVWLLLLPQRYVFSSKSQR